MATVRDICIRALRKSGVAKDHAPDSSELADAVDDLNMMLAAWKLQAVDIEHTALGADSTFPLAAEFEEGTVYLLSSRLNVDYRFPQQFDPDAFMRLIQAAYVVIPQQTMPSTITKLPSQKRYSWIVGQ